MEEEYFFKTDQLVIWRPSGTLATEKLVKFIGFVNKNSEQKDPHFSRFVDLSQVSDISFKYEDLYPIATQRKQYYSTNLKQTVRMAILVNKPLAFGMARMYQMLSDDPHFEVHICETAEEASRFLDVDISLIVP